jgi:hypothetical protein
MILGDIVSFSQENPVVIGEVIAVFLRELPHPLIDEHSIDMFASQFSKFSIYNILEQ